MVLHSAALPRQRLLHGGVVWRLRVYGLHRPCDILAVVCVQVALDDLAQRAGQPERTTRLVDWVRAVLELEKIVNM